MGYYNEDGSVNEENEEVQDLDFDDWKTEIEVLLLRSPTPCCLVDLDCAVWVDLYVAGLEPDQAAQLCLEGNVPAIEGNIAAHYEMSDLDVAEALFYNSEVAQDIPSNYTETELEALEREAKARSARFALAKRKAAQ